MTQLLRAFGYLIPIFLLMTPFVFLSGYFMYQKRRKRILNNEAFITMMVDIFLTFSTVGVLLVTVFPSGGGSINTIQLIPFVDISHILFNSVDISALIRNIGFNVLLFVPFGMFISWRLTSNKVLKKALALGIVFSIGIEILQFLLPLGRTTSIDDIILNSLGTFVGAIFYITMAKVFPNKFSKTPFVNLRNSSETIIRG